MNNKDKKTNIKNDELNIRSHLNASLDLNGISVSEDLINRTLEAINKQTPADNSKNTADISHTASNKKVISWNKYVRGLAGVAAAVLIIFVGYNVMKNVPGLNSKSDKNFTSSTDSEEPQQMQEFSAKMKANINEDTTADTTAGESADAADDTTSTESAGMSEQYTTAADNSTAKESQSVTAAGSAADSNQTAAAPADSAYLGIAAATEANGSKQRAIQDLGIPAQEDIKSITITNNADGTVISLTDQTEIRDFYSIINKYTFTITADSTLSQNYTMDLTDKNSDTALYTILAGDNVTVKYKEGESVSENTYTPSDIAAFQADLDNFYKKYSK